MRLHLANGTHCSMSVRGSMYGLRITGATLDAADVTTLLNASPEELRLFLQQMLLRFAPIESSFPDDYEV